LKGTGIKICLQLRSNERQGWPPNKYLTPEGAKEIKLVFVSFAPFGAGLLYHFTHGFTVGYFLTHLRRSPAK
jgi:hypothetical protein